MEMKSVPLWRKHNRPCDVLPNKLVAVVPVSPKSFGPLYRFDDVVNREGQGLL